jgi:hypothetical protein
MDRLTVTRMAKTRQPVRRDEATVSLRQRGLLIRGGVHRDTALLATTLM